MAANKSKLNKGQNKQNNKDNQNSNYNNQYQPMPIMYAPVQGMMQPMMMNQNGMGMMPQGMMQPMMMNQNSMGMMQPMMMNQNGMGMMQPMYVMAMPQQQAYQQPVYQQPVQQMALPYVDANANNNQAIVPINHDINIQEMVEINEEEEDNQDEDNEQDVVHIPQPKVAIPNKQQNRIEGLEKRIAENNKQDNQLADMFNNVLDGNLQEINENNENNELYNEFGQEYDNGNVIIQIKPLHDDKKHYDKQNYPNEVYDVVMLNGNEKRFIAKDISQYTLETSKIVNDFNNTNKNQQHISGKGIIYARCSTINDISIETQLKSGLEYAKKNKIELLSFGYQYDNNVSARNMDNLKRELGFWKDHIPDGSHLIIYSVDRLSRNLLKGIQFLDEMTSRNISVHFITNELVYNTDISAAGKAMIQQELQTAEKYSNMTSEKIKGTFKRLRNEGHVFGRAPYGYKHILVNGVRKRIPDNSEQANINKIQSRYNYYVESYDNCTETKGIRKCTTNIIRVLLRWCIRNGLKYRGQKQYTQSQIRNIIEMDNNHIN